MTRAFLLLASLAVGCAAPPHGVRSNVLFVVVDNMRPALGAYNVSDALTPRMDRLAAAGTVFARAYCQIAWCSPSRNSFMVGRRPGTTHVYNFVDDFRGATPAGASWVTLPQYFKQAGYYTTSIGKVFHPARPANFDFPASWTDVPDFPAKAECPNATMTCEYNSSAPPAPADDDDDDAAPQFVDADTKATDLALARLSAWAAAKQQHSHFFLAVGLQSPRLPWSFPASTAARFPPAPSFATAAHWRAPAAAQAERLEWFRPVEVDFYVDVINVTHGAPMALAQQQRVRRAYYAAIAHVDDQVGRLLDALGALNLTASTAVVLCADHGQNLGENNMWSMMNLLETSLRVPLVIRPAPHDRRLAAAAAAGAGAGAGARVAWDPVELVDLFPSLAALAGLPPPPAAWGLDGRDITGALAGGPSLAPAPRLADAPAAFGQITRCRNCTRSYIHAAPAQLAGCALDARSDAANWTVPCCFTDKTLFDWMGVTVRTADWRLTAWCGWDGAALAMRWDNCTGVELFDHRGDAALFDVDSFENENVAADPGLAQVREELFARLKRNFK